MNTAVILLTVDGICKKVSSFITISGIFFDSLRVIPEIYF